MLIDVSIPVNTDHLALEVTSKLTPKEFAEFVIAQLELFEETRQYSDEWILLTYERIKRDLDERIALQKGMTVG